MKKRNNISLYIIFVVIIVFIVTVFILFFSVFNKIDKQIYQVEEGSIVFDDDFGYIKVEELSNISQKLDGNYYIYEETNDKNLKYKIGQNAVIYNEQRGAVYIYGKVYQVTATGNVDTVEGETEIIVNDVPSFYKLADRKYLIVGKDIRSVSDAVVNTKQYLIIELDKQGRAIFANNEMNFKSTKLEKIRTSLFEFDVANEKLKFANEEIDLKNIIGSTNEYTDKKTDTETKTTTDNKNNNNSSGSTNNYYDKYLTEVIKSVNNLANGVSQLNEKSDTVGVGKSSTYYEVSKWIALRSVIKDTTSITLDYYIFDPGNEYQAVFAEIKNKYDVSKRYFINKDNTSYIIRDLEPDSEYTISIGYYTTKLPDAVIVDEVKVKTSKPNYSINIDKIVVRDTTDESKIYDVYFTLNIDKNYVFNSAIVQFYANNVSKGDRITLCTKSMANCTDVIDASEEYHGKIEVSSIGTENKIALENVKVCNSEGICNTSDISVYHKFFNE